MLLRALARSPPPTMLARACDQLRCVEPLYVRTLSRAPGGPRQSQPSYLQFPFAAVYEKTLYTSLPTPAPHTCLRRALRFALQRGGSPTSGPSKLGNPIGIAVLKTFTQAFVRHKQCPVRSPPTDAP